MKKIGLLGGSFNPIHTGHLLLAESARCEYQLDKIIFIPTGSNPFKENIKKIRRKDRMNMVKLAIASNPFFDISDIEIKREGKSYTIDTINELSQQYKDAEFYFITGADIMFEITRWREAETLLRNVTFVTSFRPGYSHKKLDQQIEKLKAEYNTKILKLISSEMDIASSDIRNRIKENRSYKYLIPESVEAYIKEHHLYQ